MDRALRSYFVVTLAYWAFTLTDGALRMLVLLHFHALGFTPVELAFLFLFYEFFGVVTNLLGGWIAARMGLRVTLFSGLALQVIALSALAFVAPTWPILLSVAYVMAAQALSGIAKDLTKMSAKSSIKVLVPADAKSSLFKWVAVLTGSKNALKGIGFFLGGLLLSVLGFRGSLWAMAAALVMVLLAGAVSLPAEMGKAKSKSKFSTLLSKTRAINTLSAARFFLFGARDIWFVVGVPVFLSVRLGWGFTEVGAFLALWVVGYGAIQAIAPLVIRRWTGRPLPRDPPRGDLRGDGARDRVGRVTGRHADRRARGVRRGVRRELVGALVSDSRVLGWRQGRDERGLLLHGERRRAAGRDVALGRALSGGRYRGVPLGDRRVCGRHRGHFDGASAEGRAALAGGPGRGRGLRSGVGRADSHEHPAAEHSEPG
jgi:MFS family permease